MRQGLRIAVVIPALNEAAAIGAVLAEIPAWVDQVVVGDNGSTDATPDIARAAGAEVAVEPQRGYGATCLAGLARLAANPPDIVVFLDGDRSDHPDQMDRLVDPICSGQADLVIGSRRLGRAEAGALTPQQRFGNWLATLLIRLFWSVKFTDLGPFRAISWPALQAIGMRDRTYGWTVEMQVRAAQLGLMAIEVPVDYRRRIGRSKISGTLLGVWLAGTCILGTIARAALADAKRPARRSAPRT